MHKLLQQIIEKKKADLAEQKKHLPQVKLQKKISTKQYITTFTAYLLHPTGKKVALIAEIKLASPTEQDLGSAEDILPRAKQYAASGADAISFITEKHFFKGDSAFIPEIKKSVKIPVLQKDFVIDTYQIYEAKLLKSDALLLIARILDTKTLQHFVELCFTEGIEPVVEIHNEEDLEKALATTASVIAVNARDLDTFTINVEKACELLKKVPDKYITLGFSGIKSAHEVAMYQQAGAKGVLIGTSLMKTKEVGELISSFRV